MTERPILLRAEEVRAVLAGRKSQLHVPIKPQPSDDWNPVVEHYYPTMIDKDGEEYPGEMVYGASDENEGRVCPFGAPGGRLWVKETWAPRCADAERFGTEEIIYRADYGGTGGCVVQPAWRPSVHMPRWASRLTLEVCAVRVERLADISAEDAKAEGVRLMRDGGGVYVGREGPGKLVTPWLTAVEAFRDRWNDRYGPDAWALNSWCWCLSLRVIDAALPAPA